MKLVAKRKRSDSAAAAVAAAQAVALGPLDPPAHVSLRECDRPFWDAIMRNRPRDTWNESDLVMAANLARTQADVERLQAEVYREGEIIAAPNGALTINPRCRLIETLSRRAISLAVSLHVHVEATVGKSRDQVKAHDLEKQAAADHDDLIPVLRAVK